MPATAGPGPVKRPDSESGSGSGSGSGSHNDAFPDNSDSDDDQDHDRGAKRKRPFSVSCELCKQRKVKCDRGQPACGWCARNGARCEYKERKKPGLRAGYGRELEARLDKLEAVLRQHADLLHLAFEGEGKGAGAGAGASVSGPPPSQGQGHAEAALFLQTPAQPAPFPPPAPDALASPPSAGVSAIGISPAYAAHPSPLSTPAAREYYGASVPIHTAASGGAGPASGTAAAAGSAAAAAAAAAPPAAATPGSVSTSPRSFGPPPADHDLPPYDLSYALVDLYFKHINAWCPLLQRGPTIDALFGPGSGDETNQILLHAIVATTLRFSADARLTDDKRQRYHAVAKNRVLLYGLDHSSVRALQALVVLALDICGSSHGPPGWNIMALITRAVVQLGLAVETNSFSVRPHYASIYTLRALILPEPRDFVEEESRRRLFWAIYLLDRYATIATAFEFALDDREIDRTLPCRDDLWARNQRVETRLYRGGSTFAARRPRSPPGAPGAAPGAAGAPGEPPGGMGPPDGPADDDGLLLDGPPPGRAENLGAFSYYIEILGIFTQIHNFLKQPVDISSLSDVEQWQMRYRALDQTLNSWKVGLPGEYGNMARLFQPSCAKTVHSAWIMLHVAYHTAIIRLHSSSAYPTTRSPIFTPSYSASQRCHGAVENIATLTEFVVEHGLLPRLGPPFAFSLWVAARLYLVHGSTVEHKLSPRVGLFVDTLRAMGRYWPVAGRYHALLQRVLDEHRESQRHGDGVPPSSVQILADMRRTAFDLDLLISRQPRHVAGGKESGTPANPDGGVVGGGGSTSGANPAAHLGTLTPGPPLGPPAPSCDTGTGTGTGTGTTTTTPPPHELEYLDVFDFFNLPRLPFGLPTEMQGFREPGGQNGPGGEGEPGGGHGSGAVDGSGVGGGPAFGNEFNITDFMIDANRDWLYKDGGKYLA